MTKLLGVSLLLWTLFLLVSSIAQFFIRRKSPHPEVIPEGKRWPKVTVLIPAFNEGKVLEGSVKSTVSCNYPSLEVVVINDGSSDDTLSIAKQLAGKLENVTVVDNGSNQGKAKSLNNGIRHSTGEYVVVVDADTILDKNAIKLLIAPLLEKKYRAICGNVKVGNRNKFLTLLQSVEYITTLNLMRRAQELLGFVTTIPGAIGAFEKSTLIAIGGYPHDTLIEDSDVTFLMARQGYKIAYQPKAVAYTEAPPNMGALTRQRVRWATGFYQIIVKYWKDSFRNSGTFLVMLCHVFTHVISPASIPIFWVALIASFISQPVVTLSGLAIGVTIDYAIALLFYMFDRENLREIPLMVIFRFLGASYISCIYFLSFIKIIFQAKHSWHEVGRDGQFAQYYNRVGENILRKGTTARL